LEGIGGGGISMDCSVEPTRHAGVWNITTTDFFFPLVEDPYLQGRIGCCNVLSDLYAMGVTQCDRCFSPPPRPHHDPPTSRPAHITTLAFAVHASDFLTILAPFCSMLMLVAASLDMPAELRLTCTGHMMRGFNDVALAAGTKVPDSPCFRTAQAMYSYISLAGA
jgi:hypothetical protein